MMADPAPNDMENQSDAIFSNNEARSDDPALTNKSDNPDVSTFENKSNYCILQLTSILFFLFVIAEVLGALASNSLSLMADAASMSVDVFSYLTNMYAEHVKTKGEVLSDNMKLFLAAGIPSFSLCCLVGVTIWIIMESADIIMNPPEEENVDILFMYGFAAVNLLIDIVCLILFYYNFHSALFQDVTLRSLSDTVRSVPDGDLRGAGGEMETTSCVEEVCGGSPPNENSSLLRKPNLNMMAAFSHVGADLLRTLAVFAGAAAASTGVNSDLADAWAAIICSVTIFVTIVPLVGEIGNVVRTHFRTVAEKQNEISVHYT